MSCFIKAYTIYLDEDGFIQHVTNTKIQPNKITLLFSFLPWKGSTYLQPWQSWNHFNSTAIGLHPWKVVQKAITEDSKN